MPEDRPPQPVVADRRVRPTGRGPRERRVNPPQLVPLERRKEPDPWDDGGRGPR